MASLIDILIGLRGDGVLKDLKNKQKKFFKKNIQPKFFFDSSIQPWLQSFPLEMNLILIIYPFSLLESRYTHL